jgi:hypothetical protein
MVTKKAGIIFLGAAILLLLSSGCSLGANPASQPTLDVNMIYTYSAQTMAVQWTQTAAAAVTPTLTPVPSTPTITFTPTVSPTWTTTAPCEFATFIEDVSVPDNTVMTPGQDFLKTWKVQNTGSCAWAVGYSAIFGYGDRMDGQPVVLTSAVMPGEMVEVTVQMKAPTKIGEYQGYWRMSNTKGQGFGRWFAVKIIVK